METISQDEIDDLVQSIQLGEAVDVDKLRTTGEDSNERNLRAACKKLISCYENEAPEYMIEQARKNVHCIAHRQWLKRRRLTREEYINIIREEIQKRGLVWCPQNPPGYKLIPAEAV